MIPVCQPCCPKRFRDHRLFLPDSVSCAPVSPTSRATPLGPSLETAQDLELPTGVGGGQPGSELSAAGAHSGCGNAPFLLGGQGCCSSCQLLGVL